MGRPEGPVDPEAGGVQRLAHELRELRRSAGSPSYRTMAKTAGFSWTTLSQAAAGERLPSLAVLQGYVLACGGDPDEWEPRWTALESQASETTHERDADASPPYRGLARYEPDDHALFFGRDRLVEELRHLLCDHRFAVLFGASGSGKSSLLRAGLIPRLRDEIAARGRPAVVRVLTPGDRPAQTHGHLLTPAVGEPESWVVVDQFEEVFTLCRDPAERTRFVELLLAARAPESLLRVLIAVRADFFVRCAEHRGLADALRGSGLLVGPMTADELREAVVKPALAVGYLVERELTKRIVEDVLDQPGGLPMLSHALLETWRRRRGRVLTLAGFEAAGGVHGAIAATAEEVYGSLSPAQARTAQNLLMRMVEPGQGTPDTRRPLPHAELRQWPDPAEAVVERLTRARLLTVDEEGVQLAHEALITSWPRLHGWIEENRERLRHHRMLADAARSWLEHDRDPGVLYRGARLARAEELFPDHADDPTLTVTERVFLTAALKAREDERRAAARIVRRHRFLTVSLAAVLAVALLTAFGVWHEYHDNQRRRTEEAARRVADVADALRTTDPRSALLLGAAAWRIARLPETRRSLLGSLAQQETDSFTDPAPGDSAWRSLTASGGILLSAADRTWRTWDTSTHGPIGSGRLPDGVVVAAGPDARVIALNGDNGVRLWDTAASRWTGDRDAWPDVSEVRFTGNGRAVLTTAGDRMRLRSVTDGRVLFEAPAPGVAVTALSTNGRYAALCADGQAPRVWDTSRSRIVPGAWQKEHVCDEDTAFLALDAHRLAAATAKGISLWDTGTGRRVADLADPGTQYMSFSPDGAFLATVGHEEIRVWRLSASGEDIVFRHPLNNRRLYGSLAWNRHDGTLHYLEGGTAHTLDLGPSVTSTWRLTPLNAVCFSPDGHTYATAERSGGRYLFQLRSTADDRLLSSLPPVNLPGSQDPANQVVPADTQAVLGFSPDGTALTYGVSAPGREAVAQPFTVWDIAHRRVRTIFDLRGDAVVRAALGPGGRILYAARMQLADGLSDEVWDAAARRRTAVLPGMASFHLAVRPDGGLLVGDGRLAALPSGRVEAHDLVQGEQIGAAGFSRDGSLLAVGDQTGRVALWDGKATRRAGVLPNLFPAPLGDTPEAITAVAISPDSATLAVGGDAGSVQLWDVATRQPLGTPLTTPGDGIESLAFSSDGTTLYAGSLHVPLQRYAVDARRAVSRVCARVGTDLTRQQWRTYVPGAPYRRICGVSRRAGG